MKYVSFLFAVALIGVAALANASEQKSINFNYTSNENFYSCSYVEGQASKTLALLGAENIETTCQGGIDHGQFWPVSMTASFTHDAKGARTVRLRGREGCEMNVKLIKTILATIDHEIVQSNASCMGGQGSYNFIIALK